MTLKAIGGKWKLLILWYVDKKPRRFGELKRLMPRITEKMLTQQLRELESDGLINRTVVSTLPLKVQYTMSEYGQSLHDVLQILCGWGTKHLEITGNKQINRYE